MHTTMVLEQVKILKIQAGVQASRPEDLEDIFSIGSALEDVYFVVFVLVRNIEAPKEMIGRQYTMDLMNK
ncbi:hypothetical protein Tco_0568217 [Tanacetum coccineum]